MINLRDAVRYIKAENENLTLDNRLFLNIILIGFLTCLIAAFILIIIPSSFEIKIICLFFLLLLTIFRTPDLVLDYNVALL